jgi:hypothetical protein
VVDHNKKENTPIDIKPKDVKPVDSGIKKDGKKKKIKKIIYYETNFSTLPSPSGKEETISKCHQQKPVKTKSNHTAFNYSRISHNSNAHLLFVPLGKTSHFDGEYYSWWSHKMRSYLYSIHPCIWDIVGNGMQIPDSDDEDYCVVQVEECIHRYSQATTILLPSLCREEYNKVNGLENAKEIWDTLKVTHEGNLMTIVTKMELIEGELSEST